jgi:hypothetical protein
MIGKIMFDRYYFVSPFIESGHFYFKNGILFDIIICIHFIIFSDMKDLCFKIFKINGLCLKLILVLIGFTYYVILDFFFAVSLFGQTSSNLDKKRNSIFEQHPYYIKAKSSSQNHSNSDNIKINALKKQQWTGEKVSRLMEYKISTNDQPIQVDEINIEDYFQLSYRINGQGLIKFQDGSWVYLISNSNHNNSKVGDLTIAIDDQGNKYTNDGHICGGLVHSASKDKIPVEHADHFLKYFKSDADDQQWKEIKIINNSKLQSTHHHAHSI